MQKHHPGEEALARKFANLMGDELKDLLSEAVFFGSSVRNPIQNTIYEKDIDILLIFNDLIRVLSREVIEAYRIITENTAAKVSGRLHITTMRLTNFWEYTERYTLFFSIKVVFQSPPFPPPWGDFQVQAAFIV